MKQYIRIIGPITSETVHHFFEELGQFESKPTSTVYVEIYSEGGDADAAVAIAMRIRSSTCTIVTIGYGIVQSAAVLILAAGDRRLAAPNTTFMVHASTIEADGKPHEIMEIARKAQAEEDAWNLMMRDFSKMTKSFWGDISKTDHYFKDETALVYGIIDEILKDRGKK